MSAEFVEIDADLTLHYEQAGRGDSVILLVPGWTMSTRVFERQLAYFEDSDQFRFITFDPRAHGLSGKTTGGHNYQQHGLDLGRFIEALQLERLVLGGWSFGCLETLAYINQFGAGSLTGLIMLDGSPRVVAESNLTDWATYSHDDADGSQAFYSTGRITDPETTNLEFAEWMLEDKSTGNIEWVLEITRQTPNEVATVLNESSIALDYRADLTALEGKMPLWYMVRAQQDRVVSDWARQNTPSALVQAYGEHLMFWERADRFNSALVDFAGKCTP